MNCDIQFNAFISGDIGKPLCDLFKNHPLNNPRVMENHRAFNSELRRISGTWFSEPFYPAATHKMVKTDNRDFREEGSSRLFIEGSIDLRTIGNMRFFPFKEPECDYSHRRSVYIKGPSGHQSRFFDPNAKVVGVVKPKDPAMQGEAATARNSVENTVMGTYFTRPGTPRSELYDGTIIRVGGSAGYPYLEPVSPNIDFDLTFKFHKVNRRHVRITVEGTYDGFPCYELLVNNRLEYTYNPLEHGQEGPNPSNLDRIVRGVGNGGYICSKGKRFSTVINLRLAAPLPEKPKQELFPPVSAFVNGF